MIHFFKQGATLHVIIDQIQFVCLYCSQNGCYSKMEYCSEGHYISLRTVFMCNDKHMKYALIGQTDSRAQKHRLEYVR